MEEKYLIIFLLPYLIHVISVTGGKQVYYTSMVPYCSNTPNPLYLLQIDHGTHT